MTELRFHSTRATESLNVYVNLLRLKMLLLFNLTAIYTPYIQNTNATFHV